MEGWHNLAGIKRVYILGAGFSAPAGMPLTHQLLPLVFKHASGIRPPDCQTDLGQAEILLDALRFYQPNLTFKPERILKGKLPKGFDFEKFLTYMAVNSAVQMGTGEQLDEHGNQELSYFMDWTAAVIRNRQLNALRQGVPDLYLEFAKRLVSAIVFTFNWDTLLENALDAVGCMYQLDRHKASLSPEISLLKLHGSIDWYSSEHCLRQPWMRLKPLGESLPELSRAIEPLSQQSRYSECGMTPWIVLPNFDKLYHVTRYGDLWQMLYLYLQNELTVYFIGFSMRPDDYHTHAILYPQLVHGAKAGYIRVKVVDYAATAEQQTIVKQRFRGIPGTEFWFKGFAEAALDFAST